jgi:hypothetical protein
MDLTCCLEKSRGATTDNFLTSLILAENLMRRDITLCSTKIRNRNEIPHELLPKETRGVESSIFALHDEVNLVSYVPKKNRTVIALSTGHHDSKVGDEMSHKPDAILHYNAT